MPKRVEQEWVGQSGRVVRFEAFVPDLLVDRVLALDEPTLGRIDAATAALARAESSPLAASGALSRLLLRAEGIASSEIEQIRTSTDRLALGELGAADEQTSWVMANVDAIQQAVDHPTSLTVETVLEWHRSLMTGSRLAPRFVGELRDVQNWIGGPDPGWAVFVPPPPELVAGLMDDLVEYANRDDLPGVVQAAVLHGQFETIHPFADGNGRVGRALIGWCLRKRGLARGPLPPLSPIIVRSVDSYIAGLHDFREGDSLRWFRWFAGVCVEAARLLEAIGGAVDRTVVEWRSILSDLRSDSSVFRILNLLAARGALDVRVIVEALGVSERTARAAMGELERRGIARRTSVPGAGRGRPPIAWVADEILELLG